MEPAEAGESTRKPSEELAERIAVTADRLDGDGRALTAAGKAVRSLGKPAAANDLVKLEKATAKVEQALPADRAADYGIDDLVAAVREYVADAEERIRRELGVELKAACAAAGLGFRVVSREDPVEVRIPPLLLRLDFKKGQAELLFAREVVATAKPEAEAIVKAHATACRKLEAGFSAEQFFDDCLSAWRASLAARGRPAGDRVEILDFLPYLALAKQSKRFKASPAKATFTSYGKARFAFDVLRLRRAGVLARNGQRLNFGVATGTTATQKSRVVYLEDEQGDGEYKLTVFFTPTGER